MCIRLNFLASYFYFLARVHVLVCFFLQLEAKHAEYEELQKENKELEATIQSLRLKIRELERLAEDNKTLEESNNLLNQEKENKEKEIKKLRQTLEVKESTIDEYRWVDCYVLRFG